MICPDCGQEIEMLVAEQTTIRKLRVNNTVMIYTPSEDFPISVELPMVLRCSHCNAAVNSMFKDYHYLPRR